MSETGTPPPRIDRAAVAAAFPAAKAREERRSAWAVALVFRPLSFRLCPLVARLGIGPGEVTALCVGISLLMPVAPVLQASGVLTGTHAVLWLAACLFAFELFDCVDGDLARVTGSASPKGAVIDGVSDIFKQLVALATFGFIVATSGPPATLDPWPAFLGVAAGASTLLAKFIRNEMEAMAQVRLYAAAPPSQDEDSRSGGPGLLQVLSGFDNAWAFPLVGALALDQVTGLLWLWAAYAVGDLAITVTLLVRHPR